MMSVFYYVVQRLLLIRLQMIHLSIALLLQRLRGVDIVIEATIVTQLVPLALAGSKSDLVEVYRAFSQISRSSHPEDPRMESNAILAAQTKLAQGLGKRLDCAEGYLVDLLNLFADKGTQTQMISMAANGYDSRDLEKMHQLKQDSVGRVSDMRAWLGALLVPISALLSHVDFHPAKEASTEMTTLFRNLWFICVAFGLSGPAGKKRLSDHEWNALGVIAQKSPCLVLEGSSEYVDEDLEYSSILRKDFAAFVTSSLSHRFTTAHLIVRSLGDNGPHCLNTCRITKCPTTYEAFPLHRLRCFLPYVISKRLVPSDIVLLSCWNISEPTLLELGMSSRHSTR